MGNKVFDPNVDKIPFEKEVLDGVMSMWSLGITVRAIGNYFKLEDAQVNVLIDAYSALYT
jgi:hypothetical protein